MHQQYSKLATVRGKGITTGRFYRYCLSCWRGEANCSSSAFSTSLVGCRLPGGTRRIAWGGNSYFYQLKILHDPLCIPTNSKLQELASCCSCRACLGLLCSVKVLFCMFQNTVLIFLHSWRTRAQGSHPHKVQWLMVQAEETHNTLKFAARAKKVKITASRNKINDERSQIMMYQQQVNSLKQQLHELKAQAAMSTHSFSTVAAPVSVDDMHVRPYSFLC